ncbi:hypothetical protein LT493_10935 [Streptomyces tricolor]|nr:hypothetical protein [Streptomyces tricolor]
MSEPQDRQAAITGIGVVAPQRHHHRHLLEGHPGRASASSTGSPARAVSTFPQGGR